MSSLNRRSALRHTSLLALGALAAPQLLAAEAADAVAAPGFTIEYYYKIRWGSYAEFRRLYVKNHLPLLRRYQSLGYILSMSATSPLTHVGEANRWDMRFDITWKDAAHALEALPNADAITRELYPDQETFRREEQRRFELIVEHLDLPVLREDVTSW